LGDRMYRELRKKVLMARVRFLEARAQDKVTPELQRLVDEARGAFRARDSVKLEKKIDGIFRET